MPRKAHGHRLRRGRVSETGRIYLITASCRDRQHVFETLIAGRCFVRALIATSDRADTLCHVVMPDHVHWVMQLRPGSALSRTVQAVKALTTRHLTDAGYVKRSPWQRGFHDRALRHTEDLQAVARYVVANPLRAGLARSLRHYSLWDAIWLQQA